MNESPSGSSRSQCETHGLTREQRTAAWPLLGNRLLKILPQVAEGGWANLPDTSLPVALVRWMIEHEWVTTLDDLIERRTMLLYHQPLTAVCLRALAELLVEAGKLEPELVEITVQNTIRRLEDHFGKQIVLDEVGDMTDTG